MGESYDVFDYGGHKIRNLQYGEFPSFRNAYLSESQREHMRSDDGERMFVGKPYGHRVLGRFYSVFVSFDPSFMKVVQQSGENAGPYVGTDEFRESVTERRRMDQVFMSVKEDMMPVFLKFREPFVRNERRDDFREFVTVFSTKTEEGRHYFEDESSS